MDHASLPGKTCHDDDDFKNLPPNTLFLVNLLQQVWPQYLSLSTAHGFLVDNPEWVKKRAYYMRNISTFEPFVESIAQLIIKLCIWTFYLQDHLEKFQGEVNPLFEDSSPPPFFIFTTIISGLASILGITRFFKEGPVKFLPQNGVMNGLLTIKFILTFFSILFNLFAKILLLVTMLYVSLGVLGVFANPSLGSDLVGTVSEPKCSNITMVQACLWTKNFQVKPHFPDEKYNSGIHWNNSNGLESEWRVFKRDENNGKRIFWNAHQSQWWEGQENCLTKWNPRKNSYMCEELTNKCGSSGSIRIYCSEIINVITLSRLVAFSIWFGLNILPQFTLATVILLLVDVRATLRIFLYFPELILSPTITNMMFGPKVTLWKCKGKEPEKIIRLSPELCWMNNGISIFGNIISVLVIRLQYCDVDPSFRCKNIKDFWDFLIKLEDQHNLIALPPGLAILFSSLSIFLSSFVFHFNSNKPKNSFFCPLKCKEIQIDSIVHQIEDPEDIPESDTDVKGPKLILQMQLKLKTRAQESADLSNNIEISSNIT